MAIPGAKRQAALPNVKKQPEASKGILSHLANKKQRVADDESLADALSEDDATQGCAGRGCTNIKFKA